MHFWLQCMQDRWWAQITGVDVDKSDADEFLKDKDVHDLGGVLNGALNGAPSDVKIQSKSSKVTVVNVAH